MPYFSGIQQPTYVPATWKFVCYIAILEGTVRYLVGNRYCHPEPKGRGVHTRLRVSGRGESQFGRWERKLGTLCTLWVIVVLVPVLRDAGKLRILVSWICWPEPNRFLLTFILIGWVIGSFYLYIQVNWYFISGTLSSSLLTKVWGRHTAHVSFFVFFIFLFRSLFSASLV